MQGGPETIQMCQQKARNDFFFSYVESNKVMFYWVWFFCEQLSGMFFHLKFSTFRP